MDIPQLGHKPGPDALKWDIGRLCGYSSRACLDLGLIGLGVSAACFGKRKKKNR